MIGLYQPDLEHDACGIGFVAHAGNDRSHLIIEYGLEILEHLAHRGGCGADPKTGDGAGILIQVPHALFVETAGITLPAAGEYGVGMFFLPAEELAQKSAEVTIDRVLAEEGLRPLGWRRVPLAPEAIGDSAKSTLPHIAQLFVGSSEKKGSCDPNILDRKLFIARRVISRALDIALPNEAHYVCSLSTRTIVYKGLLRGDQLRHFYPDLTDPRVTSALALIHQRFSTNTFPSWERAHPYRLIAHNGEINTIRGNQNWMRARERTLASEHFGHDLEKALPVIEPGGSDSAMFDNALELLVHSGRSLPHALMMMVQEPWEKNARLSEEERAFYEYQACSMEPWDGPAAIVATDGRQVAAVVDRNGLRPARYSITEDRLVVLASETGVLDLPIERVVESGRLEPGGILLVDLEQGRIEKGRELKRAIASAKPYRAWLEEHRIEIERLPPPSPDRLLPRLESKALLIAQRVHGYTEEELKLVLGPMAINGEESIGSMGNDAPIAVLSARPQLLFHYFKQLFAQVTNPPIDPIREDLVMSLATTLGAEANLLEETPDHCRQLVLLAPVISSEDLGRIRDVAVGRFRAATVPALFQLSRGGEGLEQALDHLTASASALVRSGVTILIVSDRGHDREWAPIPSLLGVGAVHHHLVREGLRTRAGLVIESGEPREVMHFCLLAGYGAAAINPYLALESVAELARSNRLEGRSEQESIEYYLGAANKGLSKVMSKMGVSTLHGYRGAQIFEVLGLRRELVDRCFTGTPSRLEGIGFDEIAEDCRRRAEGPRVSLRLVDGELDLGGVYQWRRGGEPHLYTPEIVMHLQHAVRTGRYAQYEKYAALSDEENRSLPTIRGLLDFHVSDSIPIDEVEPAAAIVRRFKTGAMSLGSISKEAHENLAIAMNQIGGRSNTGEGGEDPARFVPDPNGDSRRSAIKQVASARFGVTIEYLVSADELQIKMAQGAKPGEGGQLPGRKVDAYIARLRCSTPGVGLISPPPHHDIYSIEDLAQLIFDLRCANPDARISVKLVSEVGVGTIAAGVAKAGADVILISGDSGGTGAAPLTSIKHAGVPWELGLAEAHQVLALNGLRGAVRLETDGQLRTGRDVAMAALLGAEEFGFATSALVASGCIMMRACHLNTCPVGVATQDPELRKRFAGRPEHVINMMMFIAEDLRRWMAKLGFRTVDEMVGRVDRLARRPDLSGRAAMLDLSALLFSPVPPPLGGALRVGPKREATALDRDLLMAASPVFERRERVRLERAITNRDRSACTRLSGEVARRFGDRAPLSDGTIEIFFRGTAGQSFCAFLGRGIDVHLEGAANDYFGKGLSGGVVSVRPAHGARTVSSDSVLIGNVALYGATSGEAFIAGPAGERFGVRNSGARAVVEGVGDHGLEYMTRGAVVVLGPVGRNFGAGMSGGIAWVLDPAGTLPEHVSSSAIELMKPSDAELLVVRRMIERHYERTRSALAWRVLSGWREHALSITRVISTEYRRLLERGELDLERASM